MPMFSVYETLFTIVFVVVLGTILITVIRNLLQWNKNNHSPKLTVDANIAAKRTHVSRRGAMDNTMHHTTYYVTFQVESGDRMEMNVSGQEYGMLTEGDHGKLTFQGTRYLDFQRS